MICFNKNLSIFVCDGLAGETSCDTFLKVFDFLFAIHEAFDIHTGNLISECRYIHSRNRLTRFCTVAVMNDQFLRNVNHSSGQVTGIGCTKRCIGHTFTGTMRRHEVFQYFKTFTEV